MSLSGQGTGLQIDGVLSGAAIDEAICPVCPKGFPAHVDPSRLPALPQSTAAEGAGSDQSNQSTPGPASDQVEEGSATTSFTSSPPQVSASTSAESSPTTSNETDRPAFSLQHFFPLGRKLTSFLGSRYADPQYGDASSSAASSTDMPQHDPDQAQHPTNEAQHIAAPSLEPQIAEWSQHGVAGSSEAIPSAAAPSSAQEDQSALAEQQQPLQAGQPNAAGPPRMLRTAVPEFLPHKLRAGHRASVTNFEQVYKAAYMETYGPAVEDHDNLQSKLAVAVKVNCKF